jgi:GMP synthase-like glutamine amidotransferase
MAPNGAIMGVRVETGGAPLEGVQFHPESILTAVGKRLLGNFLALVSSFRSECPGGPRTSLQTQEMS